MFLWRLSKKRGRIVEVKTKKSGEKRENLYIIHRFITDKREPALLPSPLLSFRSVSLSFDFRRCYLFTLDNIAIIGGYIYTVKNPNQPILE